MATGWRQRRHERVTACALVRVQIRAILARSRMMVTFDRSRLVNIVVSPSDDDIIVGASRTQIP